MFHFLCVLCGECFSEEMQAYRLDLRHCLCVRTAALKLVPLQRTTLWMRLESGHEQESIVAGAHWKTKVASNEIESTRLCVFRPILFQYGIGLR